MMILPYADVPHDDTDQQSQVLPKPEHHTQPHQRHVESQDRADMGTAVLNTLSLPCTVTALRVRSETHRGHGQGYGQHHGQDGTQHHDQQGAALCIAALP